MDRPWQNWRRIKVDRPCSAAPEKVLYHVDSGLRWFKTVFDGCFGGGNQFSVNQWDKHLNPCEKFHDPARKELYSLQHHRELSPWQRFCSLFTRFCSKTMAGRLPEVTYTEPPTRRADAPNIYFLSFETRSTRSTRHGDGSTSSAREEEDGPSGWMMWRDRVILRLHRRCIRET